MRRWGWQLVIISGVAVSSVGAVSVAVYQAAMQVKDPEFVQETGEDRYADALVDQILGTRDLNTSQVTGSVESPVSVELPAGFASLVLSVASETPDPPPTRGLSQETLNYLALSTGTGCRSADCFLAAPALWLDPGPRGKPEAAVSREIGLATRALPLLWLDLPSKPAANDAEEPETPARSQAAAVSQAAQQNGVLGESFVPGAEAPLTAPPFSLPPVEPAQLLVERDAPPAGPEGPAAVFTRALEAEDVAEGPPPGKPEPPEAAAERLDELSISADPQPRTHEDELAELNDPVVELETTATSAPEPATLVLLATGLVTLMLIDLKRRRFRN